MFEGACRGRAGQMQGVVHGKIPPLGDAWERHMEIHACWEKQRGDAGELSSADRLLTCLTSRPDAAFPLESTQVPESHPITYLQRGAGREV